MIELSNINGLPIETVGELEEILKPFTNECRITPLHVFYKGINGNKSAELIIALDGAKEHTVEADDPYFKCLGCGKFVDPAIGHVAYADGTFHWQCHPQLKKHPAVKRMSSPNPALEPTNTAEPL